MTDPGASSPEEAMLDLVGALGRDRVNLETDALREISEDLTEVAPGKAQAIVRPRDVDEIKKILVIAGRGGLGIVPMVANTNVGGLAVPDHGGIILDLREMNRIIEVNEKDLYMVIEPGVTWQDVRDRLDRDHPTVRMGYSLGPPDSSVLCNCLLTGLTNLSLKHGHTGDWVNGLEVVLASGEIVRTGAVAMGGTWCTGAPAPDLTGLFINMQGTTGIVTKMAVQIHPRAAHRSRGFILAYDVDQAYALVRDLVKEEICDDIGGLSWPIAKMLFGEERPVWRDPSEPVLFIYTDISAHRESMFQAKLSALDTLLDEHRGRGAHLSGPLGLDEILPLEPRFGKFAEFPTRLDFLLDRGGLTWIGAYGPTSRWEEGIRNGMEVMEKRGFPPLVVTRPMRGGHYGVLRFLAVFDKRSAKEVQEVRELNAELSDVVMEVGFVPYKTPPWVLRRHKDRIDPGFLTLLDKVRSLLDPEGILNPGKWSP